MKKLFFLSLICFTSHAELPSVVTSKCLTCHSTASPSGDFTSIEKLIASGVIKPGDAQGSSFMTRILKSGNGQMPPGENNRLSHEEAKEIERWISSLESDKNSESEESVQGPRQLNYDIKLSLANIEVQRQIYKKCYEQFTGHPLIDLNRVPTAVTSQVGSAVKECMRLLNLVDLSNERNLIHPNIEEQTVASQILNNFNKIHIGFFPNRNYTTNIAGSHRNIDFIHDALQPSYYFTKNLFDNTEAYKEIYLKDHSLYAIRKKDDGSNAVYGFHHEDSTLFDNENAPQKLSVGKIAGLRKLSPSPFKSRIARFGSTVPKNLKGFTTETLEVENKAHMGSGLLGSFPFLVYNSGDYILRASDGGLKVNRTFSKNLFKQLLCRDLPVIRPGDSINVDLESSLPFKAGLACMRCHSSIDTMGHSLRNYHIFMSEGYSVGGDRKYNLSRLFVHDQRDEDEFTNGTVYNWPDKDDDFFKKEPLGKLYFRSFNGELIDKPINGLKGRDSLGQKLIETDDLYACTAKKYFKHFTGIEVSLDDLGSIDSPSLSEKHLDYRAFVIELGKELKKDQDLKRLIHRIISSRAYVKPGIGVK